MGTPVPMRMGPTRTRVKNPMARNGWLRAARLGLTQTNVANGLLVAISGNGQLAPSYFMDPATGVNYTVQVKAPLSQIASPQDLMSTPFSLPGGAALLQNTPFQPAGPAGQAAAEPLSNFASLQRIGVPTELNHYTVQRVLDVMASVEGRDLGSVVGDIQGRIKQLGALPPNTRIRLRGQFEVMVDAFVNLGGGLVIAIILVSFANDVRVENPGMGALEAALLAGRTRLRPVLMTALAMILGMLPMALGMGEAGSQNAPLGRAVIGGLLMATLVTLFIVPVVYSLFRQKAPTAHLLDERFDQEQ